MLEVINWKIQMKNKAFTIIEFLVVIGIVALLVVIILPNLHRSSTGYNSPTQTAPNVWEFKNVDGNDNFSSDVAEFSRQHPELKIVSQTGADHTSRGFPMKYIVITDKAEKTETLKVEK
jgi:prepilin-type N-terminal cleavage/methylation domain-containing protein